MKEECIINPPERVRHVDATLCDVANSINKYQEQSFCVIDSKLPVSIYTFILCYFYFILYNSLILQETRDIFNTCAKLFSNIVCINVVIHDGNFVVYFLEYHETVDTLHN